MTTGPIIGQTRGKGKRFRARGEVWPNFGPRPMRGLRLFDHSSFRFFRISGRIALYGGGNALGPRVMDRMRPPSRPRPAFWQHRATQSGRSGRGDVSRLARGIRRENKPKTIPHSPAAHGRASGEATSRRSGRLCVPSVFHPHPANPVILSRKRCPPRNIAPHAERTAKGEAPPAGILSSGGDDKFWSHPGSAGGLTRAGASRMLLTMNKQPSLVSNQTDRILRRRRP